MSSKSHTQAQIRQARTHIHTNTYKHALMDFGKGRSEDEQSRAGQDVASCHAKQWLIKSCQLRAWLFESGQPRGLTCYRKVRMISPDIRSCCMAAWLDHRS